MINEEGGLSANERICGTVLIFATGMPAVIAGAVFGAIPVVVGFLLSFLCVLYIYVRRINQIEKAERIKNDSERDLQRSTR